jgi:hypothetical protein
MVPAAEVAAARGRLARRVRLRLQPGTPLPAAADVLHRDSDGTVLVQSAVPPLDLLRAVPADALLGAEIGVVRLEELYQQLLVGPAAGVPAAEAVP